MSRTLGQVSTEPRPRPTPHIGLYLKHVVVFAQSPSEANVLSPLTSPWPCASPFHSLKQFPSAVSAPLPWLPLLKWGTDPLLPRPQPPSSLQTLSWPIVCCSSDRLIIVWATNNQGNPPKSTYCHRDFLPFEARHFKLIEATVPDKSCPSPSLINFALLATMHPFQMF